MTLSDTLREIFTGFGWKDGSLYLLSRSLNRARRNWNLYKYYLVAQPVSQVSLLAPTRGKNLIVRRIEQDDPLVAQMDRPPEVITMRYRQGSVCLGALKGDELAGFLWLHFGPFSEDEVRCHFVPDPQTECAWDFDVYVAPKYRFSYAFARLWDEANMLLRERDIRWTMSRISAFNKASLASHAKLGIQVVGSAVYIALGNIQLTFATQKPWLHLSLARDTAPKLRVPAPDRHS